MEPTKHTSWLDRPKTHQQLFYALIGLCVLLLIGNFFIHPHGHFPFEEWFGFHAFFGFLAYSAIVGSAILLRKVVKRREDYYDD
jgi:hypothetical protein